MGITIAKPIERKGITALHTGAWEIRNNCSGKGQWMVDQNTPVGSGAAPCQALRMVVLGYTTLFGIVPAISSFDDLDEKFKMMSIPTKDFTPEDYYTTAYQKLAKYWGYVLFVPAPSPFVNPKTLPDRVVCGTLIKSTGLNKPVTGFLGNKGLLDKIQMDGQLPQTVITTASIEPTHSNPLNNSDVNGVVWSYEAPKTKEEKALIDDVSAFLSENGSILNSLLPKRTLRQCTEVDLLKASDQERSNAEAKVMSSAFSWCPDLAALAPAQAQDILTSAVEVLDDYDAFDEGIRSREELGL